MTEFEELSAFLPLLELHGLSRWWFYKQWKALSCVYTWMRTSNKGEGLIYVPREEMLARILISSKRKGIAPLLAKIWNVLLGKRMTHIVSKSHGTWHRHYKTVRSRARFVISTPEDILSLQPRFYFFADFLDLMKPVLLSTDFIKLKRYLTKVKISTDKIIAQKSIDIIVQKRMSEINYEEFYSNFLDKILYGEDSDEAFKSALETTPLSGEHISTFEVVPTHSETVENASIDGVEADAIFEMDFNCLKKQLFQALLSERLLNASPENPKQAKARKEAGLDMAIFLLYLQHATDDEIRRRLRFKGTRQRLTQRRARVLEKARTIFSVLRD